MVSITELVKYTKGLSVLYVEDDDEIREIVAAILAKFFKEVNTAVNGQEGLDIYKQTTCDLVISDIRMPVMDGIEMVKNIKDIESDQPVIITSAYDDSEYLLELINAGVEKFILKPIDDDKFLSVLLQVCRAINNERDVHRYRTNIEAIFRSVGEAIITVDKEMRIIEVNEAAKNICGLTRSNVIGKKYDSVLELCSGNCVEFFKDTIQKKHYGEKSRLECHHKDQEKLIVTITSNPLIDQNGKFMGAVMVIKDETYVADLEKKLKEHLKFHNIIGKSKKMQKIYSLIEELSDIPTTVLITGESGTGKELVAEAIHNESDGDNKPFIKVNCSALPENLIESELFGHVKGAFTDAIKDTVGRFQKADGGTVFLDEIGDISLNLQMRLLRVIQEGEFERVGDSTPIKVNVRIIAATNQDLQKKIKQEKFREDLYYRLKVVELSLPPLRERKEDLQLLIKHIIERFNNKLNRDIVDLSKDVYKLFMNYSWPGNIRELEHTIEHAFVVCRKSIITVDNLPKEFLNKNIYSNASINKLANECERILQALEKTHWKKTQAAKLLGISRGTLYSKLKKCNIE